MSKSVHLEMLSLLRLKERSMLTFKCPYADLWMVLCSLRRVWLTLTCHSRNFALEMTLPAVCSDVSAVSSVSSDVSVSDASSDGSAHVAVTGAISKYDVLDKVDGVPVCFDVDVMKQEVIKPSSDVLLSSGKDEAMTSGSLESQRC